MKGRYLEWVAAFGLLALPPKVQAQEGPLLAVFDIESQSPALQKQTLGNLTDYLSAKLAECGYRVIPRDQIRGRLLEQKKGTYQACVDEGCQIELGRELAAQKVLESKIIEIGGECKMTSTLYDLKKAAAEMAATHSGPCLEADLVKATEQISIKLCSPLESIKKVGQKAISDFDMLLKDVQGVKERKEQIENTWGAVSKMAQDKQLPWKVRIGLLNKFLETFKEENPYQGQAQQLIVAIQPGTLLIRTWPPGARVSIDGNVEGSAPLQAQLFSGEHRIGAHLDGFEDQETGVSISPGKQTEISLQMKIICPMDPVTKWGHMSFWIGAGMAAVGGVALWQVLDNRDAYQNGDWGAEDKIKLWSGTMFAGLGLGAALMTTGVILWVVAPSDQEWQQQFSRQKGFAFGRMGEDGWVVTFSGRW